MRHAEAKMVLIAVICVAFVWIANGFYLPALSVYSKTLFWLYDFFQWVVFPLVIMVTLAKKYNIVPRDYGFDVGLLRLKTFLLSIAATITFYPATILVDRLVWMLSGQPEISFSFQSNFPEGTKATITWLYSALSAGIIESIFFISIPWMLWKFYKAEGKGAFILLSAFVFSLAHWEQGMHALVAAFSYGVVACLWYLGTRNIWVIIIGHTVIDLIAFS